VRSPDRQAPSSRSIGALSSSTPRDLSRRDLEIACAHRRGDHRASVGVANARIATALQKRFDEAGWSVCGDTVNRRSARRAYTGGIESRVEHGLPEIGAGADEIRQSHLLQLHRIGEVDDADARLRPRALHRLELLPYVRTPEELRKGPMHRRRIGTALGIEPLLQVLRWRRHTPLLQHRHEQDVAVHERPEHGRLRGWRDVRNAVGNRKPAVSAGVEQKRGARDEARRVSRADSRKWRAADVHERRPAVIERGHECRIVMQVLAQRVHITQRRRGVNARRRQWREFRQMLPHRAHVTAAHRREQPGERIAGPLQLRPARKARLAGDGLVHVGKPYGRRHAIAIDPAQTRQRRLDPSNGLRTSRAAGVEQPFGGFLQVFEMELRGRGSGHGTPPVNPCPHSGQKVLTC
jgi:hypothetical protein